MMRVKINPFKLNGTVLAPPSKSFAHRALICSALSDTPCLIRNIEMSDDIKATFSCVSTFGCDISEIDKNIIRLSNGKRNDATPLFECFESGSTLRFMIPIALTRYSQAVFRTSPRLFERGIGVYCDIFKKHDISVSYSDNSIIFNGSLTPGDYEIPGNISSQYISGLLFALPLLDGDSTIKIIPPVDSRPYIDITLDMLKRFNIDIKEETNTFYIKGNQKYRGSEYTIEGDWSNGAALLCYNYSGSDLTVENLNGDSIQGDRICVELFDRLHRGNIETDISQCPDLAPVLFAFAAVNNGGIFHGTDRLKIKECDRAQCMKEVLDEFGIKSEIEDNTVIIHGGKPRKPGNPLSSFNDHRIVMAQTFLLSFTGGYIDGAEAVNKSFPSFFEKLKDAGMEMEYENQ